MQSLQIENRHGKLKLNSGVHKESADKLIEELGALYGPSAVAANLSIGDVVCSADDALESVEVEINSPGGSVFEGQRIYSALREMSSRGVEVTTKVNGIAASMGSVILMAGDKRQMTKGSRVMIHEASTMAMGDARTLRKSADLLEGISAEIAEIYAERTGGEQDAIRILMLAETWMDAKQAKASGFIHDILDFKEKTKATNEFDTTTKPMSILSKLFPGNDEVSKVEAAIAETETLRADLGSAQARIDELAPLAEANAALQIELAAVQATVADLEASATESAAKIVELAEAATVTDEKIQTKASELLAASGHPAPVAMTAADEAEAGNTMSREDFTALKPATAMKFIKAGGKLTN